MNDGFFAWIATWCLIIVVWSGWLDQFFREQKLKKSIAIFVLFACIIGGGWTLSFSFGEARLIPFLVPLAIALSFWSKQEEKDRLRLAAASALIGVSILLIRILFHVDPILMITDEKRLLAIFVVVLVAATAQHWSRQWMLLVFGLALADIGFQLYMLERSGWLVLGSPFYLDVWWLSFYLLAIVRVVISMRERFIRIRRKQADSTSIARIEEIK